jgi:hypothetical protein
MTTETAVTLSVARHLGNAGHDIVSIAFPGDGSGVIFHGESKEAPSFVPDIISRDQNGKYVIVEAKPKFSPTDAKKLYQFRSEEYEKSIMKVLGVELGMIITALAFGEEDPQNFKLPLNFLIPDLIFAVDGESKTHLIFNNLNVTDI